MKSEKLENGEIRYSENCPYDNIENTITSIPQKTKITVFQLNHVCKHYENFNGKEFKWKKN